MGRIVTKSPTIARIDPYNPDLKGLVAWADPIGHTQFYDHVSRKYFSDSYNGDSFVPGASKDGRFGRKKGGAYRNELAIPSTVFPQVTIVAFVKPKILPSVSAGVSKIWSLLNPGSSWTNGFLQLGGAGNTDVFTYGLLSGNVSGTIPVVVDQFCTIAFTNTTSGVQRMTINGVQDATSASTSGDGQGMTMFKLGDEPSVANALECYGVMLFNRILSDDAIARISENRRGLLERPRRLFAVPAGTVTSYTLTAASTSFAVTGNATGLKADRRLAATTATFGITGNAAGLKKSYALQATQASYALTGNATALKATRRLTAAFTSFALTGNAVTLTYTQSRTLQVVSAGFTLTGNTVAMLATRRLAAAVASYSLTGTAIGLNASRRLSVSAAAYTLTGQTAALRATRRLAAAVGTYALTGIDVTLTKSTARTLTAVSGAYAVTGQAASLRATRRMTAGVASFALSGSAAGLAKGFRLAAVNGSFALTGQQVAFRYTRRMAIEPGLFALTGNAVTMTYTGTTIVYARAPAGSGYSPRRDERQSRPRSGNTTRPSNTQRNNR